MIRFAFSITNPFIKLIFKNIFCKSTNLTENKIAEVELYYSSDELVNVSFDWTVRQDHAGLRLIICFVGLSFSFHIYDNRHWDTETNNWESVS